jgi:hypothetical protein
MEAVLPRRNVYAELLGQWSTLSGPAARLEAGAKALPWLGLFGAGTWTPRETRLDGGVRVTW